MLLIKKMYSRILRGECEVNRKVRSGHVLVRSDHRIILSLLYSFYLCTMSYKDTEMKKRVRRSGEGVGGVG